MMLWLEEDGATDNKNDNLAAYMINKVTKMTMSCDVPITKIGASQSYLSHGIGGLADAEDSGAIRYDLRIYIRLLC